MIVKNDFCLAAKTTMKIGGYADAFYIPENEEELINIAQKIYDKNNSVYILSGGSNLLINDDRRFEEVIYMGQACDEMKHLGDGEFFVGASNRIQNVISFVNDFGYGGFERLVGLPALFGGIIYMNAGIGGKENALFTISDFVLKVRAWSLVERKIVELSSKECCFGHRFSVFHNNQYLILGAYIKCENMDVEQAQKIKEERLQFCKSKFEYGKGCFGTCFSSVCYRIIKILQKSDKIIKLGKGRVTFGKTNPNWLVNRGNGTFRDAMRIIDVCKKVHRMCFRDIKCEVIIWE